MSKDYYSIIRQGEYNLISKINLDGSIIDLGGSSRSSYRALIGGNHKIVSVNINPDCGCDLVFDLQKKFPIDDFSYDNAICFNVLEHIFDFNNVFLETSRILKSGGKFIISTPFMHHIHASPDDYFRYTKSALVNILTKYGLTIETVTVIGYGPFSFIFQTLCGGIKPIILRKFFKAIFIMIDKVLSVFKKYREISETIPLGYFIVARKN